jgi:PAS domain S-box-containing protein
LTDTAKASRPGTGRISRGRTTIAAIAGFNLGLIALIWYVAYALVRNELTETIRAENARNDTLAIAFEQYTERTLDGADALIRYLIREYGRSSEKFDLQRFVAEYTFDDRAVSGIVLSDESGTAATAAFGGKPGRVDISDREHFKVHAASDTRRAHVGKPVTGRASGRAVVPVSRRINKSDGSFGGVAIALIEPVRFVEVLREARLREHDTIALVTLDGITVARLRGSTPTWGDDIRKSTLFEAQAARPVGNFAAAGQLDNVRRLFSYRTLAHYGLIAVVGSAESDVLAGFHHLRTRYFGAAAITSAGIAVFTLLLVLVLARQRRATALFRTVVQTADEGIWLIDAEARTTFVNPRMAEMLGFTSEEMLGRSLSDFVFPDDWPRFLERLEERRRGVAVRRDSLYRRKDGGMLWTIASFVPQFDEKGTYTGLVGMISDITERKAIEERIRASESGLAAAQRIAHVGSWERDLGPSSPGALRWSDETFRIFGYAPGSIEVTLEVFRAAVHADDREKLSQSLEKAIVHGVELSVEHRIVRPDGAVRIVREVADLISDGGAPRRLVGTVQDITEQKSIETRLLETSRRLGALSDRLLEVQESERATLARELHDEFGQTLTAVQLQLHSLNKQVPGPALEDCLALVEQALNQVRSLSLDLRPPQLDSLGLAAALEAHFRRLSAQSGLVISFHCAPDLPSLVGACATACFRIAQEAVTNAMRHSGATRIEVILAYDAGYIELTVRDDGSGFDVPSKRASASRGASLGLLSMQERSRMFRGTFEIRSQPGSGTEVSARLALEPRQAHAP